MEGRVAVDIGQVDNSVEELFRNVFDGVKVVFNVERVRLLRAGGLEPLLLDNVDCVGDLRVAPAALAQRVVQHLQSGLHLLRGLGFGSVDVDGSEEGSAGKRKSSAAESLGLVDGRLLGVVLVGLVALVRVRITSGELLLDLLSQTGQLGLPGCGFGL